MAFPLSQANLSSARRADLEMVPGGSILREDLLQNAEGEEVAVHAVCAAFPDHGKDA